MRRFILVFALAASLVCVLAGREGAQAEPLSVAMFCELSIARLQLATDAWEQMGRSPTDAEGDTLWQQHGTTAEEYYTFASAYREEVDGYLTSYPEVQAQIERLIERLEQLSNQVLRQ